VTLGRAFVRENDRWRRALTVPRMLDGLGTGNLCRLREQNRYGRELPVGTVLASGKAALAKWLKRELKGKNVQRSTPNSQHPMRTRALSREEFESEVRPLLPDLVKPGTIVDWIMRGNLISIRLDYANVPVNAHIDSAGKALIDPPERENLPEVCRGCDQFEHDRSVAIVNSPAYAWRYLGFVEGDGTPTTR